MGWIGRSPTILLGTALLLGACNGEEVHSESSGEEVESGSVAAVDTATTDPDTNPTAGVRLETIPFQASGDFPHGEHRRIECGRCHGSPAGHVTHGTVSCTDCHGVPSQYATLPIRSEAECMACHHDPDRPGGCDQCHASEPREAIPVRASLRMSVWPEERVRELAFEHALHGELACGACHGEEPERPVTSSCASCHEEHHTPAAACRACHETDGGSHHEAEAVHRGCDGQGCHQDPAVLALPANRVFCLVCHQEETTHEEGEACTGCHLMEGFPPPASSPRGGP